MGLKWYMKAAAIGVIGSYLYPLYSIIRRKIRSFSLDLQA